MGTNNREEIDGSTIEELRVEEEKRKDLAVSFYALSMLEPNISQGEIVVGKGI